MLRNENLVVILPKYSQQLQTSTQNKSASIFNAAAGTVMWESKRKKSIYTIFPDSDMGIEAREGRKKRHANETRDSHVNDVASQWNFVDPCNQVDVTTSFVITNQL